MIVMNTLLNLQGYKHSMKPLGWLVRGLMLSLSAMTLSACSALGPSTTATSTFYSIDNLWREQNNVPKQATQSGNATTQPTLTLAISPPHAAAGFDSARMLYVRQPHKIEYFAHNEWIEPPARMLEPLLVAATERTGAFRAVVMSPNSTTSDLRLNTEIIRLQHDFSTQPSRVRFTLRATLVDDNTRRVIAGEEFDESVEAKSEDPYGGVLATNAVIKTVLEKLAVFSAAAAQNSSSVAAEYNSPVFKP